MIKDQSNAVSLKAGANIGDGTYFFCAKNHDYVNRGFMRQIIGGSRQLKTAGNYDHNHT